MTTTGYRNAAEIKTDRVAWALALLIELINEGRRDGWLEGATIQGKASAASVRQALAERMTATTADLRSAPLEWMAMRLGINERELDVLWLLACVEVEPAATRLAQAFGSELSVQLVQRLMGIDSAQLDELERLALIEVANDRRVPLTRRPIRLNDRVLEIVRGELRLDGELEGVVELRGRDDRGDSVRSIVSTLANAPVVIAIGPEGAGRTTLLARAAGERGFGTLRVRSLAADPSLRERQLRAVIRESCLFELVPLFQEVDRDTALAIQRATKSFAGPVLVTARESLPWRDRPVVTHLVERPRGDARAAIWRACMPAASDDVITRAAASYELRPGAIIAAARNASAGDGGRVTIEAVHEGVRARIGDELGTLATRIDWRQTWEDLVLPAEQFEQIVELVARVRHRSTVLETWGFGAKVGKGHGVTALFSGPPGTGKTMVAGLVAKELGLDLYQVDLSKIVSKYIGETEKQLASLFDAAEAGHAVLLFDEADSLFAKRTEVKSSNDRYANLEVNFLLQRMESFTGISILTTNHETSIDEAFRRRLALHVRFPVPEEEQRVLLWKAMLPAEAPVAAGVDVTRLARDLEMSGGYIKNAVLRAAYLAAEEGTAIGMTHLLKSARAEYDAMGKIAIGSM